MLTRFSLLFRRVVSYFVAYEVMKKRLTPAGSTDLSLPAVMAAGAFAGVAMWSIAIPPDVSLAELSSFSFSDPTFENAN
jgi:hypothetical protein